MTLLALLAGGSLLSLLISLLILALIIWLVIWIIGLLRLPEPARTIVCIIVAVIFLVVLLQHLGVVL